jgi:hypothetical protein
MDHTTACIEDRRAMRNHKTFDRIIGRTARRLSKELERMCADLDEMDAPTEAFECVLWKLNQLQPGLMTCLLWSMSDFLAEMEKRTKRAAPIETAEGMTIH